MHGTTNIKSWYSFMNCGMIFGNEKVLYLATHFGLWKEQVFNLATHFGLWKEQVFNLATLCGL